MKNKLIKIGIISIPFFSLLVGVAQVKAEPYGWSPQVDFSNQGTPTCTDAKPDKSPILLQPNHPVLPKKPKKGEVVLYWHKVSGATGYNIYYGLSPKNYIFSVPDIGDTDNYTVGYLPNKLFYFAVQAKKGCAAGSLSKEWAARPGQGGYQVGNTPNVNGVTTYNKVTPITNKVTQPEVNTLPSQTPSVQGVQTEKKAAQPTYNAPQYNPPQAPPVAVPVKPKAKGLWEMILSILFGK